MIANKELNFDSVEYADGTKIQEQQNEKYIGTKPEDIGIASKGSYSYNFPETIITVNWVTDEKTKVVHAYIQISYPVLQNLCRSMSCTTPDDGQWNKRDASSISFDCCLVCT